MVSEFKQSVLAETLPSISVIIPVYNGVHTLKHCLEAVLAPDGASSECIVVNDRSTDDSLAMVTSFPGRVRLLDLPQGPRGPAYARNRGAEMAHGEILFFVDADVVLMPGGLQRIARTFGQHPELAALFGSYDAQPWAPGLISQYRNLLHHFMHQNGNPQASTFWAGCGAIRKKVFEEVDGFDEERFSHPSIEDIELGYRLRSLGFSILLDRDLQGGHLKKWSFTSLVKTDIFQRAMPWSRLILESKTLPNDLNLKWRERVSFVFVALSFCLFPLGILWPACLIASAAAILAVAYLNRTLYASFLRQRGALFVAGCIPLHLLYYLYSGLTYVWVWASFRIELIKPRISRSELNLRRRISQRND